MRRRDHRCPEHGLFEYVDSIRDPVLETLPCPTCGGPSKRQAAVPIIGKIDRGTWVTDFPAGAPGSGQRTTLTRDEVERRLAHKPEEPLSNPRELEAFRDRTAERIDRLIAKDAAGELPPPKQPTAEEVKLVEKALAK